MLDYKDLDNLVRRYQQGDEDAGQELIRNFEGFLVKFLNLIKGSEAKLDISGNSIICFLSLYIKNKGIRKRAKVYYQHPDVAEELLQRISWVQVMFERFDREEIYQLLVIILLEMGKKYKVRDDGVYCFHTYVAKAYHFRLFRYLQKLISDPASHICTTAMNEEEHPVEYSHDIIDVMAYRNGLLTEPNTLDEINENWVRGLTCSEVFRELGIMDRKILRLYYGDLRLSDQKIADKLGLCRSTVNRKRLAAKRHIIEKNKRTCLYG